MCEFCTRHGEGKKWYLEMQNYSQELLHAEITAAQQRLVAAQTRLEWNARFIEYFVLPAAGITPMGGSQEFFAPDEDGTGEGLLTQRKVEHFGQVLPIEDVEQVLDLADSITRMPCGCRYLTTGLADRRYCFGLGLDRLGIRGKYPQASASLEVLSREEARSIFRRYDQEGLIHSIWTGVTPYVVGLCNCDQDCGAYGGYIKRRGLPSFFRAEYICQVDWDLCTGCKECISQCQFGALFYSSALGRVHIDPTRCFGCGVCRAACPTEAITLLPRQASPQARETWLREPGA